MSVSQIKKQFDGLATYLARDTIGQEKLKDLKDAVNVLRTQLSSAEIQTKDATELTHALRNRAQTAEWDLAVAKQEIQRLQQLVKNLSRDLSRATSEPATELDREAQEAVKTSEQELKGVIKRLRKKLPFCPAPVSLVDKFCKRNGLTIRVYDRDSIAKGWSYESLWTLGATVAMLAAIGEAVAVRTGDDLIRTVKHRGPDVGGGMVHIARWMERNIDWCDDGEMRAGIARLRNYNPDPRL